ncbi:MAG TPA: polysaccharide deacetylase family protein [Nocardioides sp.]|nr:polysaccharide deacetylase family protein [Nocardioides sp.]
MTSRAAAAAASLFPLRRQLTPAWLSEVLSGQAATDHVALTFDDGPDPVSTPRFLDLLATHGVRATFFLLGHHAAREPALVRRITEEGHELGVHGWTHRAVARIPRHRLATELAVTRDLLQGTSGAAVRWYRPPYGITTRASLEVAADLGLVPVLWTAWGRDWERRATPARVTRTLRRTLAPGGTILLHDTDRTSAPRSWQVTLAATEQLLARGDLRLGPLSEHGLLSPATA